MISHDKIFGEKPVFAIERNFRGTCSSAEMLKGYIVGDRLGNPVLGQLPLRPSPKEKRAWKGKNE